ncbi:NlpC/P60 family protein [uncultured Jannaschia sp.]|uniref:NlpC/P60 family protein n=1 Tax=uncultured Jannaschia sp. TaxID=293347 RepID=UPI00261E5FDC|nr:NlpC/P60 family protein [uncultured Jannaschia sp.]
MVANKAIENRVVSIAREWIGTPYVHQASRKGAGTDCLGLIRGVWRELYGREPLAVPNYTRDWGERQAVELLETTARQVLGDVKSISQVLPGRVLLFRMREGSAAKHLGLVAEGGPGPTFIHAYSGRAVHESALSQPWRRRLVGQFAFPERPL